MHKKIYILIYKVLFVVIISTFIISCSLFRATMNSPFKTVVINDPGEIYSSYGLSENESAKQKILDKGISNELLKDIITYSEESSWPALMQTLDSRLKNREKIMNVKARLVTSFDDICILVIPAKENKHLPVGLRLKKDFYILINCDAIYYEE